MKKKPASTDRTQYLIFLSHASYDKWIAEVIREKIESAADNVKVWLDDRDLDGGDRIPDTIQKAIEDCDELLVLITPFSKDRTWVTLEIGAAWGRQKRIVPLCYHVAIDNLNDIIRDRKAYQLNDFELLMQGLLERLRGRND